MQLVAAVVKVFEMTTTKVVSALSPVLKARIMQNFYKH